jgi:hypothetical protein
LEPGREQFRIRFGGIVLNSLPYKFKLFLVKFLAFYGGCAACYWLQKQFGLSAVVSSALTGLVATLIPLDNLVEPKRAAAIVAVIYVGSFAGMCSARIINNYTDVVSVSLVGTSIYFLMRPHLTGFGGKLGTVAFMAGAVALLAKLIL